VGQRAKGEGKKTEDGGLRAKGRGKKTEDGGQKAEDGGSGKKMVCMLYT
jgi:hypothetical protein